MTIPISKNEVAIISKGGDAALIIDILTEALREDANGKRDEYDPTSANFLCGMWLLGTEQDPVHHTNLFKVIELLFPSFLRVCDNSEEKNDNLTRDEASGDDDVKAAVYFAAEEGHSQMVEMYLCLLAVGCILKSPSKMRRRIAKKAGKKCLTIFQWLRFTRFFSSHSGKPREEDYNRLDFEEWAVASTKMDVLRIFRENEYKLTDLLSKAFIRPSKPSPSSPASSPDSWSEHIQKMSAPNAVVPASAISNANAPIPVRSKETSFGITVTNNFSPGNRTSKKDDVVKNKKETDEESKVSYTPPLPNDGFSNPMRKSFSREVDKSYYFVVEDDFFSDDDWEAVSDCDNEIDDDGFSLVNMI